MKDWESKNLKSISDANISKNFKGCLEERACAQRRPHSLSLFPVFL
eukprot:UN12419